MTSKFGQWKCYLLNIFIYFSEGKDVWKIFCNVDVLVVNIALKSRPHEGKHGLYEQKLG